MEQVGEYKTSLHALDAVTQAKALTSLSSTPLWKMLYTKEHLTSLLEKKCPTSNTKTFLSLSESGPYRRRASPLPHFFESHTDEMVGALAHE